MLRLTMLSCGISPERLLLQDTLYTCVTAFLRNGYIPGLNSLVAFFVVTRFHFERLFIESLTTAAVISKTNWTVGTF